jgi:hypothetical protein
MVIRGSERIAPAQRVGVIALSQLLDQNVWVSAAQRAMGTQK